MANAVNVIEAALNAAPQNTLALRAPRAVRLFIFQYLTAADKDIVLHHVDQLRLERSPNLGEQPSGGRDQLALPVILTWIDTS